MPKRGGGGAVTKIAFESSRFHSDSYQPVELRSLLKRDFEEIARIVFEQVPETPVKTLNKVPGLNFDSVVMKFESQTPSGSFKVRGAAFFLHRFKKQFGTTRRIFAASTGNHGISLTFLARSAGIGVTVVVPENTPPRKKDLLLHYGAEVIECGKSLDESLVAASQLAFRRDGYFLDSVNSDLIAGHTSLAIEMKRQMGEADLVFFPIGVGSGIAALLLAFKEISPKTKVVGVVPLSSLSWLVSWKMGKPVKVPLEPGLADGLRTVTPNPNLFELVSNLIYEIVAVSDDSIRAAIDFCSLNFNTKAEPTGVVGLAGLLDSGKSNHRHIGVRAATVLCGGQAYRRPLKGR